MVEEEKSGVIDTSRRLCRGDVCRRSPVVSNEHAIMPRVL